VARRVERAEELFAAIQSKGCELFGGDASALADKFSDTAEFSTD